MQKQVERKKKGVTAYCDFDGTVAKCDVFDLILERLAEPEWQEIEERWVRGEIGSRECMRLQTRLIRGGWKAIEALLNEVELEPSFRDFVRWCEARSVPVIIVSDSADRIITTLLDREGICVSAVYANHLIELDDDRLELTFPYRPLLDTCQSGLCKCRMLGKEVRVIVGDGLSDTCWSKEADVLYAKKSLLKFCQENKIAYRVLKDFQDVTSGIAQILSSQAESEQMQAGFPMPGLSFYCDKPGF